MGNHPPQIFENFRRFSRIMARTWSLGYSAIPPSWGQHHWNVQQSVDKSEMYIKESFLCSFSNWFTCLSNPDFSKKIASIHNILEYDCLQWKIKLGNSPHDGDPLFYWDSLSTNADRKCRMTNKMVAPINNFGAQYQLKWECNNAVSFVNAPQQRKNGNDCGAAGNELGFLWANCRLSP